MTSVRNPVDLETSAAAVGESGLAAPDVTSMTDLVDPYSNVFATQVPGMGHARHRWGIL